MKAGKNVRQAIAAQFGNEDIVRGAAEGETRQPVLQLLLGRGDGTFRLASQVTLHMPPDVVIDVLTLTDVDRDGRLDVVLRSGQIWRGDGAGGVAALPVDAGVRIGAMAVGLLWAVAGELRQNRR